MEWKRRVCLLYQLRRYCCQLHSLAFLLASSTVVSVALYLMAQCDGTSPSCQYHISTKLKVKLTPAQITCSVDDLVLLITPVVNRDEVLYRIIKPNGKIMQVDLTGLRSKPYRFYNTRNTPYEQNRVIVKYINKDVTIIYPEHMYMIISSYSTDDLKKPKKQEATARQQLDENKFNENDFMIGPLFKEDHGVWKLSIYCRDVDGEWIEIFQAITITLITTVSMKNSMVKLREGSTFNLGFRYPIPGLQTCELTAPWSSPDRYIASSKIELDRCSYVITNITKGDHGTWRVRGAGDLLYEGKAFLYVFDNNTSAKALLSIRPLFI